MGVRAKLREAVPFTMMTLIEAGTVGLTIMADTAMSDGMSPFVFVLYSNLLSSLLLLPYSLLLHRRTDEPFFTMSLFQQFFFLGLTGIAIAQNLAFTALSYSSPILACGMGNLIPAFSFILSLFLRSHSLEWRSQSNQYKILGSLISILGAIILTLYKGPPIWSSSSTSSTYSLYSSTPEHWVLASILFATASLSVSIWNIIQVGTLKQYPEVMTVASSYSIFGTIQCVSVSLIAEKNPSAWKLTLNLEFLVIVLSAFFGSIIRNAVQMWCTRLRGPLYVAMFKTFGIVVAVLIGVIFSGSSLHFGSVMGAFVVGSGYYTLMWGQIKEDESLDSAGTTVPLLQDDTNA